MELFIYCFFMLCYLLNGDFFSLQIFEMTSLNEKIHVKNEPANGNFVNPWQVDSIQAFTFLKCPECIFDTQGEDTFQSHAVKNHPLSVVFFGKDKIFKEEKSDHSVEQNGWK